jgi:hypothetical protein
VWLASLARGAGFLAGAACLALLAPDARADVPDAPKVSASAEEAPAPGLVRVALSKAAAGFLTEGRVRRLIDVELPRASPLAPEPFGPLDENAVHVFIDLPAPGTVTIQVQAPGRKLETRRVDVAGLAWDVAARVTAIATSESVRAQLAPLRRRPTRPHEATQAEIDAAERRSAAFSVSGAGVAAFAPSMRGGLGGARLTASFHHPWLTEELSLAALGGDSRIGRLRHVELGIGASHRLWLAPFLRVRLGGVAGLVSLRASRPETPTGASSIPDASFNLRAAAKVGLDARLAKKAWLTLDLEPGALLLDAPTGSRGAWLGAALGLSFETAVDK